ncbi:hypothetical protein [Allokutzneria sp. NRRL B-24872]|uniref:hypothetical protein n=1 Tax=Allokutzneria sp. NRRL B-24872 TaxID=1137961 RepID=UPI000A39B554|nr:hypothetical protein [Allokutzneria sp. NRRL B-24872]
MRSSILLPVVVAALVTGFSGTAAAAPAGMPPACAQFAALVGDPQAAFNMEWTENGKHMRGWKCAVKEAPACAVNEFGNTAKVVDVWVSKKHQLKFYKGLGSHKFVESYGATGTVTHLAKPISADAYCVAKG